MPQDFTAAGLALGAALCIAVGTVVRQRTASEVPDDKVGALGPITTLIRNPTWWIGTVVGFGGYAFQAGALAVGSLLLVQPILVLSLLFALPLGARFAHRSVRPMEWVWAAALTTSVAILVVVGNPKPGAQRTETRQWIVIAAIGIPLVLLCVFAAKRLGGARSAALLGIAGGGLFGVAAVLTKGVVRVASDGPTQLFTSLEFYALIITALTAISLQQSAFHAGDLQASLPATTIMEPVVASALGFLVLGEYLDADRAVSAILILAVLAMLFATVALARSAALDDPAIATSEA